MSRQLFPNLAKFSDLCSIRSLRLAKSESSDYKVLISSKKYILGGLKNGKF